MKSFAKEFLRDDLPDQRQIFLGAFGKHPGWDDHIDDIGLETESLVAAKQLLYVEGIGGQIGAWEKLEGGAQIPFRHVFVWRREDQLLIGRMWMSSDGKKRTRYPMVACAHCVGTGLPLVLDIVLAWLEELQVRAAATESPDEVRSTVRQFRDGLRDWLSTSDGSVVGETFDLEAFLQEIEFVTEETRMVRTLWQLQQSAYAARKYKPKPGKPAEHLRVLSSSASPSRSIQFWHRVAAAQLDPTAPVLLAVPLDQYWMDVIAGEPAPPNFFCLRASTRALSLSADTGAEPPETFRTEAKSIFEQAAHGELLEAVPREGSSWMGRFLGR
jgi:hypothetical protein